MYKSLCKEEEQRKIEAVLKYGVEAEKSAYTLTVLISELLQDGFMGSNQLDVEQLETILKKAKEELLFYIEDYVTCITTERLAAERTELEIADIAGTCIYEKRYKTFKRGNVEEADQGQLIYYPLPNSTSEWYLASEIDAIIYRHNKRKNRNFVVFDHSEDDVTKENVKSIIDKIININQTSSISLLTDIQTLMLTIQDEDLIAASGYQKEQLMAVLVVLGQCIHRCLLYLNKSGKKRNITETVNMADIVENVVSFILSKHRKKFIECNRLEYDRKIIREFHNTKGDTIFVQFMAIDKVLNALLEKAGFLYELSWKLSLSMFDALYIS